MYRGELIFGFRTPLRPLLIAPPQRHFRNLILGT